MISIIARLLSTTGEAVLGQSGQRQGGGGQSGNVVVPITAANVDYVVELLSTSTVPTLTDHFPEELLRTTPGLLRTYESKHVIPGPGVAEGVWVKQNGVYRIVQSVIDPASENDITTYTLADINGVTTTTTDESLVGEPVVDTLKLGESSFTVHTMRLPSGGYTVALKRL